MNVFVILVFMVFLHCFYDFHLQGILASMKQRDWWQLQMDIQKDYKYKNDYKMALGVHAFEWAFFIMIPTLPYVVKMWDGFSMLAFRTVVIYICLLTVNACFHYAVDDMKANDKTINLVEDQLAHLLQVLFSWILWMGLVGW